MLRPFQRFAGRRQLHLPPFKVNAESSQWVRHDRDTCKRLIVIRHGESEGNVDSTLYRSQPDNALHITERGWVEALSAGKKVRRIVGDESCCFIVSPYVRTVETFTAMAKAWGGQDSVNWTEEPRLREQDFGNFQDPQKMREEIMKERNRYGRFWYRFPSGESGADVYDRVSIFLDSTFLMRYFHLSVDEFESMDNFRNCEHFVLERQSGTMHVNGEDRGGRGAGSVSSSGSSYSPPVDADTPVRTASWMEESMDDDGFERAGFNSDSGGGGGSSSGGSGGSGGPGGSRPVKARSVGALLKAKTRQRNSIMMSFDDVDEKKSFLSLATVHTPTVLPHQRALAGAADSLEETPELETPTATPELETPPAIVDQVDMVSGLDEKGVRGETVLWDTSHSIRLLEPHLRLTRDINRQAPSKRPAVEVTTQFEDGPGPYPSWQP